MVRIDKTYTFEGPAGRATLRDLFGGRRRLIVYHFPFDPAWDERDCARCSHLADRLVRGVVRLPTRDASFAAVSRAPIANIESCKRRLGWTFPWLSSLGTTFNDDFAVALDGEDAHCERPGLSVFLRLGEDVFHWNSTFDRRLDRLVGAREIPESVAYGRTA
ncbi:MAG TPA: DUF899 family protein [Thermoanaerobaculia bacterium]